jgi:hypothetical protein
MESEKAWVSDSDLNALMMERTTGARLKGEGSESPVAQARRMMQEAAPMAAASIIRLAQYSENETVRLRASQEVLNRADEIGNGKDGKEPWADLLDTTAIEIHANDGPK